MIIEASPSFQPEKEYCFHVLFRELLGIDYRVVWVENAENYRLRLPNGRILVIEDHFFSRQKQKEYLRPENVPSTAATFVSPFDGNPLTAIFGHNRFVFNEMENLCGIDVFASAFFMLSRWEEFTLPYRDAHGRFPAEQSLAWKSGFLDRPVVNEYAELLRHLFARLGWEPAAPERAFSTMISCDVDHPRLWWSRSDRMKTLAGSVYKRGNLQEARFWLSHLMQSQDPYDVFDEWLDLFERHHLTGHFNFLGKRPPWSNCWYSLEHPFVKNLIQRISARGHVVGFHPSYEAFDNPEIFNRELTSLRAISPAPVTTGRQHYLRFAAPHTWQMWEDAGMEWDSTTGYAESEGFRCGMCRDFPVFNFLTRKTLTLREKPLIAMDVTLAQYRRYTPEIALKKLKNLKRQTARHGGEFVLLWHNSSWNTYFWADWQAVFLKGLGSKGLGSKGLGSKGLGIGD